jgi:hypothetical protein
MSEPITLDPDNDFEAVLIKMVETSRAKRKDYAGDGHPWQNFYDSGYLTGLTPGHSVESLLGTKAARLRVLLPRFWKDPEQKPSNEPIEDTLLDRAVYSVIAMCLWNEGGYKEMPWTSSQ